MMTDTRKRQITVRQWTIYEYPDGAFEHARHDNVAVKIAWTLDEFRTADQRSAAEYESR